MVSYLLLQAHATDTKSKRSTFQDRAKDIHAHGGCTPSMGRRGGKLGLPRLRPKERGPECMRGPTSCAPDSAAEMRAITLRSRSIFICLSGDWVASGGASCSICMCVSTLPVLLAAQTLHVHADRCSKPIHATPSHNHHLLGDLGQGVGSQAGNGAGGGS